MSSLKTVIGGVVELVATALIGILFDRYVSNKAAFLALGICLCLIGYMHWEDIRSLVAIIIDWSRINRVAAIGISGLVGFVLCGGIAWFVTAQQKAVISKPHGPSESPALVVRVLIARADPLCRFYQHPPAYYHRIGTELYIEITNQTDAPIYLQGYSVLALLRGQQWRAFKNLFGLGLEPDEIGAIAPDHTYLNRFDLSQNGFDYLIRKKPIGSHQAIQAWMFFESGLTPSEVFQVTQFRLTLVDSTEKQYVLFSDYPTVSSNFSVGELKVLPREPVPVNLKEEPNQ